MLFLINIFRLLFSLNFLGKFELLFMLDQVKELYDYSQYLFDKFFVAFSVFLFEF